MFGKQAHRDFTEGKILPQIFWFAIPLMITGILQLLFNTADTVMVGRWGGNTPEECETALAAVGSCGALINLIIMLFMNLSLGSGVCVAHDIGAKNYEGVKKTVHTSVILALLCGIIVMPVGIIGSRFFLDLMGTEEVVLDSAVPYMRAYFVGVPANMLYNYCASILRSAGETTRPMKYLLISGVVNVGLNAVMIFAFNLGALGVGIASATSFYLACILIIRHMLKTDAPYRLDYKKMAIDKEKLKSILLIGIPAGIQGLICSVANVMIQSTVNSFGKAVVAGNSAAANIEGYIYQPIAAFYHAAVTFVGQHKGARKYTRMKQCIYRCVACVAIVSILSGAVTVLAGKFLLGIYVPENEGAIAAGMTRVYICATTYFMCGLAEVGSGILRGLGRSTTSMTISLTSGVALRILWLLFIFPLNPKLYMLYIAFPTAWILNALAHFILAAINVRRESLNSID